MDFPVVSKDGAKLFAEGRSERVVGKSLSLSVVIPEPPANVRQLLDVLLTDSIDR